MNYRNGGEIADGNGRENNCITVGNGRYVGMKGGITDLYHLLLLF